MSVCYGMEAAKPYYTLPAVHSRVQFLETCCAAMRVRKRSWGAGEKGFDRPQTLLILFRILSMCTMP